MHDRTSKRFRLARMERAALAGIALTVALSVAATERPPSADGHPQSHPVSGTQAVPLIHLGPGQRGQPMTVGTGGSMLDLYVATPDFAVAAGMAVVLLWDGVRWTKIVEDEALTPHRRGWASAERDVVFYDARRDGADLVCPHLPGAAVQPFCRRFGSRMVGACGNGDRINIVLANGDVHRVNNMALGAEGTFAPAFASAVVLELTDAWFPAVPCAGGQDLPEIAASDAAGSTWLFDGRHWRLTAEAPGLTPLK